MNENKLQVVMELRKIHSITKDSFIEMRNSVCNTNVNSYLRAAYYYAINRSSFSGATLSGGFSNEAAQKRFTESSIIRLTEFDSTNFDIQNMDFADFINLNEEYDFMYLDPPYYLEKNSKLYGKNGNMHDEFDHEKLYSILSTKNKWIMSYNDCTWVGEKYRDYKIISAEWSYGMNKTKKSSEIIILSEKI